MVKLPASDGSVQFSDIETAIQVIRDGGMVIVMDDESRENEGDLIMAAESVTPKQCAFIIRYTTGILCAPMPAARAKELDLPRMVQKSHSTDPNGTAFTVTCDSIHTTTGVSAVDRTRTFRDLANPSCGKGGFTRPGHVFPLISREGGVLTRRGHTEASVDLCTWAGKQPVGLIGELTNDDGTMMRLDDCARFAQINSLPLITVEAMVKYRKQELAKCAIPRSVALIPPTVVSSGKASPVIQVPTAAAAATLASRPCTSAFYCHKSAGGKRLEDTMRKVRDKAGALPQPVMKVITNSDGLIVCMCDAFVDFTGHTRKDVYGHKCNFLQGEGTNPEDIADIRRALKLEQGCTSVLLNYTKSGTRFWNILTIRPLFAAATGKLTQFIGDIVTLPVAALSKSRPLLCVDDVLSLLGSLTSGPRLRSLGAGSVGGGDADADDDMLKLCDAPVAVEAAASEGQRCPGCGCAGGSSHRHHSPPAAGDDKSAYQQHISWPRGNAASRGVEIGSGLSFVASTMLPTAKGRLRVLAYRHAVTKAEPVVITVGDIAGRKEVPVRVHDQCLTSEVFGSLRCDCRLQLDMAIDHIVAAGGGAVVYLPQEGRGIGLANKIAAYAWQERGLDTVDANRKLGLADDARQYDCVGPILKHLNVLSVALLTNNPRKVDHLKRAGVTVARRISCVAKMSPQHERGGAAHYLTTKIKRMGHRV